MLKLAIIAGILSLLAGFEIWFYSNAYKAGEDSMQSFWQQRYIDSKKDAEKRSQAAQKTLTATYQRQYNELSTINDTLSSDLVSLRNRKDRMSTTTATTCKGATGAELSGRDAEFLTRESARADTIRAGLKACYEYVDAIQGLYVMSHD
jgi:hypothetical protein